MFIAPIKNPVMDQDFLFLVWKGRDVFCHAGNRGKVFANDNGFAVGGDDSAAKSKLSFAGDQKIAFCPVRSGGQRIRAALWLPADEYVRARDEFLRKPPFREIADSRPEVVPMLLHTGMMGFSSPPVISVEAMTLGVIEDVGVVDAKSGKDARYYILARNRFGAWIEWDLRFRIGHEDGRIDNAGSIEQQLYEMGFKGNFRLKNLMIARADNSVTPARPLVARAGAGTGVGASLTSSTSPSDIVQSPSLTIFTFQGDDG